MIINAQLELDKLIESLKKEDKKPSLLLHSCCAPCSSYVIEYLNNFFNIIVFYYNPNIYPKEEYLKRKNEEIRFINEFKSINKVTYIEGDYDTDNYDTAVKGFEQDAEGGNRCHICYKLRLLKTAEKCKELNYDYFATTLTVSPYKNSKVINEIGFDLANLYNIKYLATDFKKKNGYKRSIELSKQYNLYRQNYCGCVYSLKAYKEKLNSNQNKIQK